MSVEPIELTVDADASGWRLDAFLADRLRLFSRMQLRRVIGAKGVTVDGRLGRPAIRLSPGMRIRVTLPDLAPEGPTPEPIVLDVLYEDEHMIAINKAPTMVVHPAKGNWTGTLTNALAYHFEHLSTIGGPARPGIVHRLDRETSGVIVVAKTDRAHLALQRQFRQRELTKEYFAIVVGIPDRDRDVVEKPIGAHPYQREKKAIRIGHSTSREASTFFEVVERFRGFAALRVLPKTGRTHQIRVHLAHVRCPVLCDRLYGGRSRITRGELRGDNDPTVLLERQALHALRLEIRHPIHNELVSLEAPLPADLETVLRELRRAPGPPAS